MSHTSKTLTIDLALVFVFAILARLAHGGLGVGAVLNTFWPFAVGTLIGAAIVTGRKMHPYTRKSGLYIWLATAITGLVIWSIRNLEIPHISFIIVACTTSALLLLGWRFIVTSLVKTARV